MQKTYEQIFILKYYSGFSIYESYNLPVGLRNWFTEKLVELKEKEKEAIDSGSRKK